MVKKLAVLLLSLAVLFALASCGEAGTEETTAADTSAVTENADAQEAETADAEASLEGVYNECVENMPEMLSLDEKMMLNYCGIKAEDCAEYYVSICADSLRTDEIWLIKAKDEAALEAIAGLADARLKAKADESITYSPEQYEIVQKAKIIKSGDFFALLVSPDVDALEAIVNEGIAD